MSSDGHEKRTFRIEEFRHRIVVDPNYADNTWRIIECAINQIYSKNASELSFEVIYRNAYHMVLYKFGEKLYKGLASTMTRHLQTMCRNIEGAQGALFIEKLNTKWNEHNKALKMIRDILMYADRTFVPNNRKMPIHELGLILWRDNVIHWSDMQTRLSNSLLELIRKERLGEVINRGLMRNMTNMLMDLGPALYKEVFEKPFLEVSADFYKSESQEFIECSGCDDYLKKVEKRINEETDRALHYLDGQTGPKITSIMEKEMIASHVQRLVHLENSGLVKMLCDDKFEDLQRMYSLFKRAHAGLSTIRDVMTDHVTETGRQLVTDPEKTKNPVDYVDALLQLRDKYDNILNMVFNNDKTFQNALNSSFEYFININSHSAEYISLFVDHKMHHGLKEMKEEDIEVVLDKVMILFRYLQEKDIFEKYYKQHLAKRLLSGKRKSDEAERSFILKLKTQCGNEFTARLEGMFTDMTTSQDIMQSFYAACGSELAKSPTMVVRILTASSWPTQPNATCHLPREISALCEKFKSYYLGKHSSRRLSWQTNMGTASLRATFGNGQTYKLKVSTHQMCVLMLFNDAERLSYGEIEQATGIPSSDLKRSLQSLACAKGKNVLLKEPMSKDIGDNDSFSVNDEFSSKYRKVKIGSVAAQKETEPETHVTRRRVEEDRRPLIDAAIIRVMKSRKLLHNNNIVTEVIEMLRSQFLANPVEITKRIESLIDREFLEWDSHDKELYLYLA